MKSQLKKLICLTGLILMLIGICMIPSLIVAFIYRETVPAHCFLLTIIINVVLGKIITALFPIRKVSLKRRDQYLLVSAIWILVSLISAVPVTLSGAIPSFVDSFFEMCSGYSTTGSTILVNIEALPKSMLFWRSFTHWLGGMGIIVFTAALVPSMGIKGQAIASVESPGPTFDKQTAHYADTAKRLYLLYLGFTAAQTILLCFGGMSLYDALIHTFGTVGTGGFSDYQDSIAFFASPYLRWVIILFMTMCGINFNLYFDLFKKGPREVFRDQELRLYLLIIIVCTAVIMINLMATGVITNPFHSLTESMFQVTSLITTTGYATADFNAWPTFTKMLLLLLFLTGACSSSTGGGVKIVRIVIALKMIKRGIKKKLYPSHVYSIKLNGKTVPREISADISNFIFFYIVTLFVGTLLISLNGKDLVTTFSSVLTCLGNVGPGFSLVGPSGNFDIFSPFSKIVLSLLMIAGRLELYPFLLLFSPYCWNSKVH